MAAKPSRFWTKKTRDVKLDLLFRSAPSVVCEKPLWFDQMFDLFQLAVFLTHLWKTGWFRGHKKPTGGCSNYTAGTVPCLPGMKMNSEIIYEQMNKWDSLMYLVPHPLFCEVIAAYSVQWFRIRKSIKHSFCDVDVRVFCCFLTNIHCHWLSKEKFWAFPARCCNPSLEGYARNYRMSKIASLFWNKESF